MILTSFLYNFIEDRIMSMMEAKDTILKQRNMKHFETKLVNQRTSIRLSRNLTNADDQAIYKKFESFLIYILLL